MDESKRRRAIFFYQDALFFLRFYSINLRLPKVGVCENNQGKTDVKKANGADKADKADRVDKADKADKANRADGVDRADRADKANRANRADRIDGGKVDGANRGGADKKEPDRANKSGADAKELDGIDGTDKDRANIEELDRLSIVPKNLGTVAGDLGLEDLWIKRQKMARQTVTRLSFFFSVISFVYFSPLPNRKPTALSHFHFLFTFVFD